MNNMGIGFEFDKSGMYGTEQYGCHVVGERKKKDDLGN